MLHALEVKQSITTDKEAMKGHRPRVLMALLHLPALMPILTSISLHAPVPVFCKNTKSFWKVKGQGLSKKKEQNERKCLWRTIINNLKIAYHDDDNFLTFFPPLSTSLTAQVE